jgi:hypothetical protein
LPHRPSVVGVSWNLRDVSTWTSAVSHVEGTSNALEVAIKPQTFLFQMVITSCISVHFCENMVFQNPPIFYTHPVYSFVEFQTL